MANVNDPCKGGVMLFMLKNQKNDTQKKQFLEDMVNECAQKKCKGEKKKGKKSGGTKRKLSWYNCCLRVESQGKSFGEAMSSGICKAEKVSEDKKARYQKMVDENNCEIGGKKSE